MSIKASIIKVLTTFSVPMNRVSDREIAEQPMMHTTPLIAKNLYNPPEAYP
jgi:hypothetical protein